MKFKVNNSSDFELDLFFRNGVFFTHFATAGLHIRDEIFFSELHNDFRYFIKNYPFLKPFEYKINPFLEEIIFSKRNDNKQFNMQLYTRDFISYAKMGMFSFDRTNVNSLTSTNFHLVAYPILDEQYITFLNSIYDIDINLDFNVLNNFIQQQIQTNFKKSFNFEI